MLLVNVECLEWSMRLARYTYLVLRHTTERNKGDNAYLESKVAIFNLSVLSMGPIIPTTKREIIKFFFKKIMHDFKIDGLLMIVD